MHKMSLIFLPPKVSLFPLLLRIYGRFRPYSNVKRHIQITWRAEILRNLQCVLEDISIKMNNIQYLNPSLNFLHIICSSFPYSLSAGIMRCFNRDIHI